MAAFHNLLIGALLAVASTANMAATPKSAAAKKSAYGAIAWHRSSGSVGYSYDFSSARQAGVEALRQCAHPRCEVAIAIHDECAAVADGPKGFAARKGLTETEAQTKALNACGAGCKPVAWACTR